MTSISKLLSISSNATSDREITLDDHWCANLPPNLLKELVSLLTSRNGFFAFEQALQVFPLDDRMELDLKKWNSPNGWKAEYSWLNDDVLFFAQDLFGVQFCISNAGVQKFDPETGELEALAVSLEQWAQLILNDYDFLTGHSLAKSWQIANGTLDFNNRLNPKVPFIAGGKFDISNLFSVKCEDGMKLRANLANQIRNLPDGATIQFKVT
jgi:hypothetical protein